MKSLVIALVLVFLTGGVAEAKPRVDWLSGAAGAEAANGTFGRWRGTKVEIGQTWINSPEMYSIGPKISGCGGCGEWARFTGPMSISVSPGTWRGWAAEGNGSQDAFWVAMARNLQKFRGGNVNYVAPYYEFNGTWMPWSVPRTTTGYAQFRTAFARTSAIFRRYAPGTRIVLPTATGQPLPAAVFPASSSYQLLGADVYNEWPFCASTACVNTYFIARLETVRRLAYARGKAVAVPEWGNAGRVRPPSAGGGGESPALMDAFSAYLKKYGGTTKGRIVYETYFNIGGYEARFELYPRNVQPRTAAQYRARF
jgi:hypothetical protein